MLLILRSKVMIVVFLLFAQSVFSQITITEGTSLYLDGKIIESTSKELEKGIYSETIHFGKIKVVKKNHLYSNGAISQKKVKKSIVKEFVKISPKKMAIAKKISTKKCNRLIFIPNSDKSSFSSINSDKVISILPSTQIEMKLAVYGSKDKTNKLFFSDKKQIIFLNESLVLYNHFHSSLSVRPPPFTLRLHFRTA